MGENGEFHNISSPGWEGLGPSPAKDANSRMNVKCEFS